MLPFLHYYFAPYGEAWYDGAVYGNIIAVPFCALLGYVVVFRKLIECDNKRCHRFAYHKVAGTHFKTCTKHLTEHAKLNLRFRREHPEAHKILNPEKYKKHATITV